MIDLAGARRQFTAVAILVFFWAAGEAWAQDAQGANAPAFLVRPYLQPGPSVSPDGPDSKYILWLTGDKPGAAPARAASPGDCVVEYGWGSASPRLAKIEKTELRIPGPTAEQLRKKKLKDAAGLSKSTSTTARPDPGDGPQHYIRYTALLPELPRDTEVWYAVKSGQTVLARHQFRTRASSQSPVRFIALGDLATGGAGQKAIAWQVAQLKPDFWLVLGDIVYQQGRIGQYMMNFWDTYLNVDRPGPTSGAPLMASVPFYTLLGNHDAMTTLDSSPDALGAYYFFKAPGNGPGIGAWNTPTGKDGDLTSRFRAAAGASYPNLAFYSFDEGPAHFMVLDSNAYVKWDQPELLQWIEKDLSGSKAAWKFVAVHVPMFHSSEKHYTEQKLRILSPLLERLKVDVVFAGHVHNYQRSYPLKFAPRSEPGSRLVSGQFTIDNQFDGKTRTVPNGIIHIVSGGGGAGLYKDDVTQYAQVMREKYKDNWAPYTARFVSDRHTLLLCELSPKKLVLRAIDAEAQEVDTATVTKP